MLVCVDTEGFRDKENDGPAKDEKLTTETDADVIWTFDMMKETGAFPQQSRQLLARGLRRPGLRGHFERSRREPREGPLAGSALGDRGEQDDREAGLERQSAGSRVLHGQWSSPSVGTIGGVVQLVSAQGDGWVRGFEARTGRKLWEFDSNPKDAVWPKTRNDLIATPVIAGDRVYIGNGRDPEHGEGIGSFHAIDATKRGDITQSGRVWRFGDIRRTVSTAAVASGLIYISDFSGFLDCLDAESGKELWKHDLFSAISGSPMVADGKVYLGDEDGDLVVLAQGREKKLLAEMNMGGPVYGTVTPARGTLFLNTQTRLFAIAAK